MGHIGKTFLGMAALAVAAAGLAEVAEAGRACKGRDCRHGRYADEPGVYRFVYAESNYGGKRVAAPVRAAPLGDQVRLPGGNWVDCEITCEYTLRRVSIDFWEDQTRRTTSPNYFKYDFELDTGRYYRRGRY